MRVPRPALALGLALAFLATGCGLLSDAAEPEGPTTAPGSASPVAGTPAPAAPEPAPAVMASASLADDSGGLSFAGSVTATRAPAAVGPPPLPGPVATDCALPDDGSVRTLTVTVTFANTTSGKAAPLAGLAAGTALTAAGRGSPPAGSGVLVESSAPGARWCQHSGSPPASDGFAVSASAGDTTSVAVHVVVPAAAPTSDLVPRIAGLRNEAGGNAGGPWDRVTVVAGGCADDPAALCVPLG